MDVLVNLCSRTALMDSRTEASSAWFESLANRKLGADMDINSCSNLEHVSATRCSTYGAILLITARRAGYTAFSLPLLVVIKVWMDYDGLAARSMMLI